MATRTYSHDPGYLPGQNEQATQWISQCSKTPAVLHSDENVAGDKRMSGRSGQRVSDHNGSVSPYYAPYPKTPGVSSHGAQLLFSYLCDVLMFHLL